MLKFLTVLLLTILIFGMGSCIISKFFRVGGQVESNFDDFAKEILVVQERKVPAVNTFVFIQDEDTYVYFITDDTRGQMLTAHEKKYELKHPAECEEKTCLCLCREYGEEDDTRKCADEKLICKPLPGVKISKNTEIIAHRTDDDPRRQRVRIIKCAGNELYCRGNEGDISVIFDWWDEQGYYKAVK